MFRLSLFYLLSIIVICLSGCVPNNSTIPTIVERPSPTIISSIAIATPINAGDPSPVSVSPTFTVTATTTITPTLPATFTPLDVNERIRNYLQKTTPDCLAPCFWGIVPDQTTLDEARNIMTSLGLGLEQTDAQNNQKFYATTYDLDKWSDITIVFTIQEGIVKTLDAGINLPIEVSIPRKWSAYSPEALINQYGIPSKVDFFLGRVTPTPVHSMVMYFDKAKLIVEYTGSALLNRSPQLEICPITNQVDHIKIWMGDEPHYPPRAGTPLEQATTLTLEDFSKLMLGDPNKACFNLKEEAFP